MRTFLLSSFPTLSLQAPAPLTLEAFLTRCAQHLSVGDMDELEAVCEQPPGGDSAFARAWRAAWGEVRNFNDVARAGKLPPEALDSKAVAQPYAYDRLRSGTKAAWESGDPLSRERLLLEAKWDWLEERRRAAPYSEADLFAYAIQLRLLEIRDTWREEDGVTQFDEQAKTFLSPVLDQLFPKAVSA